MAAANKNARRVYSGYGAVINVTGAADAAPPPMH